MGEGLADGHKASVGNADVHSWTGLWSVLGGGLFGGRRKRKDCLLASLLESLETVILLYARSRVLALGTERL